MDEIIDIPKHNSTDLPTNPIKYPVRDVTKGYLPMTILPPLDPKLEYHEATKQSHIAETELWIKKMMTLRRRLQLNYEWRVLTTKKEELQDLFFNSDKTVTENSASTARFIEIIKDHIKQKRKVITDTKFTKVQLEEYERVKEMMEEYVENYRVYEKFLESVASEGSEFNSVRDILNRYETLELTRADCARILATELETAADIRKQFLAVYEEKANKLKTLNNSLILMQVRFREAKDRRVQAENLVQKLKYSILVKQEEATVLRGGIWDLYSKMCSRRKMAATVARNDISAQLNFIQKTISFYKDVNTVAAALNTGNVNIPEHLQLPKSKRKSRKNTKLSRTILKTSLN